IVWFWIVEVTHMSLTILLLYLKSAIFCFFYFIFISSTGNLYFIHFLCSELIVLGSFVIAAFLCLTDAVAVSAITNGKVLPKGSMSILEGESLLNDAAGIISFKIAVTALV
ncbi:cation:proton antiporter, partial [Enterobacter quasiroggenkampii]|nr:cation:proton antiporter [Enterobacter quasiroggenkampii]